MVEEKIVCEQRTDEGLRTFKENVIGTIRTIDSGGDKRVIEKINILGNYSPSGHEASRVVSKESVSPTVKEIMVL